MVIIAKKLSILKLSVSSVLEAMRSSMQPEAELSEMAQQVKDSTPSTVATHLDVNGQSILRWVTPTSAPMDSMEQRNPRIHRRPNTMGGRQPVFEASEYARLLHVLTDIQMAVGRQ